MSADMDIAAEPAAAERPPAKVRPFYWSVRRELWEHRSLYIGPLAVAGAVLFGFVLSILGAAHVSVSASDESQPIGRLMGTPYSFLAMATIIIGAVGSAAYCTVALHGERHDRSVLFWKSLPVSDLTAVLAKAAIPLAVIPTIVAAIVVTAHLVMLILSLVVAVVSGADLAAFWAELPMPGIWATLVWGLIANALWHAPLFAWLLLVSGWAKRAPLLWALAPVVALIVVETMVFRTGTVRNLLQDRIFGGPGHAFNFVAYGGLEIAPLKFLSTPGLWLGLIAAAAFLATAVWQRRRREPM